MLNIGGCSGTNQPNEVVVLTQSSMTGLALVLYVQSANSIFRMLFDKSMTFMHAKNYYAYQEKLPGNWWEES